jgi:hypothetical protein
MVLEQRRPGFRLQSEERNFIKFYWGGQGLTGVPNDGQLRFTEGHTPQKASDRLYRGDIHSGRV